MKRFILALFFFLIAGCSKSDEINIIYSSDMWGETSHCGCPGHPTGGLPRKSSFIKDVRNNLKGVYYFEIGDALFKPNSTTEQMSAESKKVDMFLNIFDKMKLDVFVPGEVDLNLGIEELKKRAVNRKFKVVLSNLVKKGTKQAVFDRTYIDSRYSKKICVFSLLSSDLFKANDYEVLEPVSVAKEILGEFSKSGCEFNILLSHLGYNGDIGFLKEMANSNLNLLIGSHDGGWMSAPRRDGNVITVYGYRRGQAVGHIGFVGGLNTKEMQDATKTIDNKDTLKRFEKELARLIEPAKGKNPEEFFKNDSSMLMRIKMIRERIDELKKDVNVEYKKGYYFNRVVAMDTEYEDDKEIEEMVRSVEGSAGR